MIQNYELEIEWIGEEGEECYLSAQDNYFKGNPLGDHPIALSLRVEEGWLFAAVDAGTIKYIGQQLIKLAEHHE